LNFRNEMRAKHGSDDPEAGYERVMIAFVNMDAPGLVILPTHRVVFGLEDFNIFAKAPEVMQYFEIQDLGAITDMQAAMRQLHDAGMDRTALLAVTAQNAFLLRARDNSHVAALKDLSEKQRRLDVVQLHKLLLEEIIGMSEEDIRAQKHLK